jgi:hypothetical protein
MQILVINAHSTSLEKMANLYAILRALDFLEMAFSRNILVDAEYVFVL